MVKKKNLLPNNPDTLVPYINAKPNAQKTTTAIPKSVTFLSATLMLFLFRDKPDSKHIKPACIKKTRMAQINNQNVSRLACKIASRRYSNAFKVPLVGSWSTFDCSSLSRIWVSAAVIV